jgi:hypothetical protein
VASANSALVAAFREKTGISYQGVRKRRDALAELVPMDSDIATYVAAHRAGVRIAKYVDPDTVRKVAEFDQLVHAKERTAGPMTTPSPTPMKGKKGKVATEVQFSNFKTPPGTLSEQQLKNAGRMAEKVYPLLYAFENSVREFVNGHLTDAYSNKWWDRPGLVSKGARETVERNKTATGKNRWVLRKTAHAVYSTNLGHLGSIITSTDGWKVFDPMFPSQSWVTEHFETFEQLRNVVAHMNPLQTQNVRALETRAQEWFDQIKDHPPPI